MSQEYQRHLSEKNCQKRRTWTRTWRQCGETIVFFNLTTFVCSDLTTNSIWQLTSIGSAWVKCRLDNELRNLSFKSAGVLIFIVDYSRRNFLKLTSRHLDMLKNTTVIVYIFLHCQVLLTAAHNQIVLAMDDVWNTSFGFGFGRKWGLNFGSGFGASRLR